MTTFYVYFSKNSLFLRKKVIELKENLTGLRDLSGLEKYQNRARAFSTDNRSADLRYRDFTVGIAKGIYLCRAVSNGRTNKTRNSGRGAVW